MSPRTRRRIALFGGSFDPVHLGHLLIAQAAQEQLRLDDVLFMPARRSPHKAGSRPAQDQHRLAMLRRAVRGVGGWSCRSDELRREGPSYTIDTIRVLQKRFPQARLYLLIGSDHLSVFHTWKDARELVRTCSLIVYERPGWPMRVAALRRWNARRVHGPGIFVSSSDVRRRVRRGRSVRFHVPEPVRRYIERHRLYR